MSTLTAWKFDDAMGAADALARLQKLIAQRAIDIDHSAVIRWPDGRRLGISEPDFVTRTAGFRARWLSDAQLMRV